MKSAEELMRVTLRRGLSPIPKLSVRSWAEKYRQLPRESAEPGRWRTSRVPYMAAVMEAFTEPGVEKIVVKSASQVGKSECLLNVLGRFAHVDPATMLIVQPTLEMSQDFSKSRLMPMINECKVLKPLFIGAKETTSTRDANQTILSKYYVGGRLVLAGANSPAGLASRPIRILLCDEVDRFPVSAGAEGDAVSLAEKRTTTYWNRKIGIFSTPTAKGLSRIDAEYELGTRERWAHACPNCGEYYTLELHQITSECRWRCPDCGHEFDEITMKKTRQKYIAESPEVKGIRSFFIPGWSSQFLPWATIMREWREAQGKPQLEKVVYNTRFGESYELTGEIKDSTQFVTRLEKYGAEIPEGVRLLTAGVDVQNDRLEYEIVGWGEGEECWGIQRGVIPGSANKQTTWEALDEVLDRQYRSKRETLTVARTFVDSGFMTSEVYEYCRRRLMRGRMAIKGVGSVGKGLIYRTTMQRGVPLTLLGVNEGKDEVYSRLMIEKPGAQYCHFGSDDKYIRRRGYDESYFRGLTAEHKVRHQSGGMLYDQWEPVSKHARNEPLDLRVYALAAMKSFGLYEKKSGKPKATKAKTWEADIW